MATASGKVSFKRPAQAAPAQAAKPPVPAPVAAPARAPAETEKPHAAGFMVSDGGNGPRLPPVEAGVHVAVCSGLFDIGTQETKFGDKRKMILVWQLPGLRDTGTDDETGETWDRPRSLTQWHTMSLNEKASLRKDYEAITGKVLTKEQAKEFDLTVLLGVNAQLQVVQEAKDDRVNAKIKTVMACPRGHQQVPVEGEAVWFHFDAVQSDPITEADIPEAVPNFIKKRIMAAPEWVAKGGTPPPAEGEG